MGRWYAVVRGIRPGLYASLEEAKKQVEGVPGGHMKGFRSKGEARAYLRRARRNHLVQEVRPKGVEPEEGVLHAYTDGSLRDGEGSASAVLALEGRVVAHGALALPGVRDSGEAEARAILLALGMAPRGSRVRVHTDRTDLPLFWREEREDPWGLLRVARELARALNLSVEVVRVPRKEVARAHEMADGARQERGEKERASAQLLSFLERLPPRYRMAALGLMERYLEEEGGKPFRQWLSQGRSETRRLLLEALPQEEGKVKRLLAGVRFLDGAAREALKDRDRERAWAEKPPTEKQKAFLRSLGYQGPEPASVLEASRLIEELVEKRRAGRAGCRSG